MTTDIIIAIILFTLTLLAYCLLMPTFRIYGGKYGPRPIQILVVCILVNCLCQFYLLLHGHITCTLIFISLNAVEALIIGLMTESAASAARAMVEMEKKFGKKRPRKEGEPVFRQYIPMNNISSPLQLDTGVEIAELSNDRFRVTIEVIGKVRLLWSPDAKTAPRQAYATPSQIQPNPSFQRQCLSKNFQPNNSTSQHNGSANAKSEISAPNGPGLTAANSGAVVIVPAERLEESFKQNV